VTTLTLHATGPVDPAEAWERYAVPVRWPEWSPQITGVDLAADRLVAGASGRVRGPLGVTVPFEVEAVDEVTRRWAWRVHVGPVQVHLLHWVSPAPDGGATTGLRLRGPAPVVMGYAPLALLAIRRLVRPL
jgi:Polyketide cyclase / dehydrase and lipid transport